MDDAEYLAVDNKRLMGIVTDREKEINLLNERIEFLKTEVATLQSTIKDLLSKPKKGD